MGTFSYMDNVQHNSLWGLIFAKTGGVLKKGYFSLIFNILLYFQQLHIFIYSIIKYITSWAHCCRPPLEPDDRPFLTYWDISVNELIKESVL